MLFRLLTVVALIVTPLASAKEASNAGFGTFTSSDLAVLKAALGSQCHSDNHRYALLSSNVIVPEEYHHIESVDESGAVNDLERRSASPTSIPLIDACPGVRVVDGQTISRAFGLDRSKDKGIRSELERGWKRLYTTFPGATSWLSVSMPGYNHAGDIAAIYFAQSSGNLNGSGTCVYLQRVAGTWRVLVRVPIWIS